MTYETEVPGGPYLSVLTVTHQRRPLLERKFASLLAQTLEPNAFEWVVVVNGCTDGTLAFLDAARAPFTLRVLENHHNEPVTVARNQAVAAARGPLLLLSDDDCLLEPDALAAHARFHAARASRPAVAIGAIDFDDGAATVRRWSPRRVGYWNVNGANSSVPRAPVDAAGGFDESLREYGGEDVLLGYRLARAGVAFASLPDAVVRHLGPDPMRGTDPERARSAGRNAVRIARRAPELALRLGVHPLSLALKRIAFAPLLSPLLEPPLASLLRRLGDAGALEYERAYLQGALEERGAKAGRKIHHV